MQRNEKQQMVDALHTKLAKADFAVAISYKDIDAEATVKLRKTFRDSKVDYKVVKNTLAKLAAKGTPAEKLTEQAPNWTADELESALEALLELDVAHIADGVPREIADHHHRHCQRHPDH